MPQPSTAHRVTTQRVLGRPFPDAPQAFAGRSREVAHLSAHLASETPAPLLVTGPAGVGKSRLLQEVLSLPTLGVIRVNCPPSGGAFFQVPSTLIRLALELPGLPSASAVEEALREAAPRLLPDDHHGAAFLGLLMGLPLPARYDGLDPRSVRLSAFAACRGLLGAFRTDDQQAGPASQQAGPASQQAGPASRPLVLLVEDLQWADAGSIEFLEHLTRVPLPPRTSLVATSRSAAYPDGKPGRGDAWRQLALGPLLSGEARELLRALAGGRGLPEIVEQAILEQAAGVPLALEEEFLSMVEEGRLVAERLHWEFQGGPEELVVRRARPFAEDERDVLAAIASLSEDATEPLLEEALDRPVADPLGRLVQRAVLQRWVGPWAWSPVKFSFRHPTDQEIALAALPEASRLALHRHGCERNERLLDPATGSGPALARALWHARESGLLAAAAPLAERLGDLARTAGLASAAAEAFTDAIALRHEGITSPIDVDAVEWHARGLDLMMKRAESNVLLGRMEEVTRDVAAVRADVASLLVGFGEMGDKKRLCRAKLVLARAFERTGDLARMEEEASEAARIAMESGDEEFVARAQGAVAEAYERRARYEEALVHAEEARRRFEGLGGVMPAAMLKGALAAVHLTTARIHADRGATAEGLAAVEKAIPFARAASAAMLPLALELHARLLRDSGDLAHALLAHEEALSIAESRSDRIAAASLWMSLGHLRREAGDASGALGAFRETLAACREMGDRAGSAAALANVGHLAHDQGDLGAASEAFREAVAIRGAIQDRVGGLTARLAWAEVEADRGLIAEAEARLEEAFASAAEMGARVAEARGLLVAGRLRRHEGRHEEASTLHARARELALAAGAGREAHEAAVEEGYDALARGDLAEAARALADASAGQAPAGAPLGQAPVRAQRLGQAPVRAPLDVRARVKHIWLEVGLRLALGQEALPLAEEALTLAHRAGLRRCVPHALEVCAKAAETAGDLAAAEAYRSRAAVMVRQVGLRP